MTKPTKSEIDKWETKLRIMMARFAMYIGEDTPASNDDHEGEIKKFEEWISQLLASAKAEGYKEGRASVLELEGMREKSVADLFPDYKHEPTREFAEQVMFKNGYNKAIREIKQELEGEE